MKLPPAEHTARAWRIHEIASDFRLEDVWALPAEGGPDDFPLLLDVIAHGGFSTAGSLPARALWGARVLLGRLFGWDDDEQRPIPGAGGASLLERVPADLRDTASALGFDDLPFVPLYATADEFAAEISNATVHGVLHLGWVERAPGRHAGRLAILVKPRGRFGDVYMSLIKPFRYAIVYPALLRQIGRSWRDRTPTR